MDWMDLLRNLLYAVITAAVPVLTAFVITYLTKAKQKVAVDTENTMIANTINEVFNLIISVVSSTSQTYVDALKKEGNFTEEAQRIAFNTTKSTILSLLSEEAKTVIETLYKDVDKWLDVQIEAAVKSNKTQLL